LLLVANADVAAIHRAAELRCAGADAALAGVVLGTEQPVVARLVLACAAHHAAGAAGSAHSADAAGAARSAGAARAARAAADVGARACRLLLLALRAAVRRSRGRHE